MLELGASPRRAEDLLATELAGASVVTLFLSPDMNLRLRPRLEHELARGARVVSHSHPPSIPVGEALSGVATYGR